MKLKERLGVKISAVILSYFAVLTLALSIVATGAMGVYKFYFSSERLVKEEVLSDMAESEARYIETLISQERNLSRYYRDKNVYYRVGEKNSGEVQDTNYNGEEYIAYGSFEYEHYYTNFYTDKYGNGYTEEIETGETTLIEVFVAKSMTKSDMFSAVARVVEIGYSLRYVMVFIVLISVAVSITLLCYLYCAAGHKAGGVIERNPLDKVPFDIITAMVVVLALLSILIVDYFSYNNFSATVWAFIVGSVDYFIALGYTMSFATRVKTRTLIKNNILYYVFKWIFKKLKKLWEFLKYIYKRLNLIRKTVILLVGILAVEIFIGLLLASFYGTYLAEELIILVFFIDIIVFTAIIYVAVILQQIKAGGEKIAKGDLEHKIDTKYMVSDFKEFSVSLNNINEGLQTAINEKMKSERFRTELITNVSHDIKTPLTSIINYVDLIKKEEIESETLKQYVDVLDRQSTRLKKLVEDLVEASKASTGSLTVNLSECDVGVLLAQTLGEFEEKLQKAGLTPVLNIPQKSVKIMADGRHLWRVFDNLMNNICKYALKGTRVYLSVEENAEKAVITFRNISANELNVSANELMERFVRGDRSRNTEGSGLGLSIAKSLAEIQGGELELAVDGDLFKAIVKFDVIK